MALRLNAASLAASSAPEIRALWLFEVDVPSDAVDPVTHPASTFYFAQSPTDVTYNAKTYIAWPIEHGGVSENSSGQVEGMNLRVSALSGEIAAALERCDGLRGQPVRAYQVFDVSDAGAHILDSYFIDAVKLSRTVAEFTLVPGGGAIIGEAQIAPRKYNRTFCRWAYKGRGCWAGPDVDGDWTEPSSFVAGSPDTCNKTMTDCLRHGNLARIGAFPSIPHARTVSL